MSGLSTWINFFLTLTALVLAQAGCIPLDAQEPACFVDDECAPGACVAGRCVAPDDGARVPDAADIPDKEVRDAGAPDMAPSAQPEDAGRPDSSEPDARTADAAVDCQPPEPCTADGLSGRCAEGRRDCSGDCIASGHLPAAEVCDRVDNDCDGVTDEEIPGVGDLCETGLPGRCRAGRQVCVDGQQVCQSNQAPSEEVCNGADDDCDGAEDEAPIDLGTPCETDRPGRCRAGRRVCSSGVLACAADLDAIVESCNGFDDDCDGSSDEGAIGVGTPCETSGQGRCREGQEACVDGDLACAPIVEPVDESCNGLDDDCDGVIDEGSPGTAEIAHLEPCTPLDRAGLPGRGFCSEGRRLCLDTEMTCVVWLPEAELVDGVLVPLQHTPCDLSDQDCDGLFDEAGEVHVLTSLENAPVAIEPGSVRALIEQLGARSPSDAGQTAAGSILPGGGVSACLPSACREMCADEVDGPGFRACLAAGLGAGACRPAPGVSEWQCADGPTCIASECGDYFALRDGRCLPSEVCNNGLDDDGDGLVDGTLGDRGACEAIIESADTVIPMGVCEDPDADPACEISRRTPTAAPDERCQGNNCPFSPRLTYDYAIDREEVSIRAYRQCELDGCCTAPAGRVYEEAVLEMNRSGAERPTAARRPAHPLPISFQDILTGAPETAALLPDLPAVGLTWCQARDYCHWAGKRLVTEVEWERAASGPAGQRRVYPWGDTPAATCPGDDCCRGPDVAEDALPGICPELPICEPATPGELRGWRDGYGMGQDDCPLFVEPGLSPVWAFPDGATPPAPDGTGQIFSLGGNVAEWIFDYHVPGFYYREAVPGLPGLELGLASVDPVGVGCMPPVSLDPPRFPPHLRGLRGGAFSVDSSAMRSTNRTPFVPSARLPVTGFRCARTVDEAGGLCASDMPAVNVRCGNARDERAAAADLPRQPRCSPSFVGPGQGGIEVALCGGIRQPTVDCTAGLVGCPVPDEIEPGPGCGSFLLSSLRFDRAGVAGADDTLDSETISALNASLSGVFAPRGGSTFFALEFAEGFGYSSGESRIRFGSVLPSGGRLRWTGIGGGGVCEPLAIGSLPSVRLNPNTVCCERADPAGCRLVEMPSLCPGIESTPGFLLVQEAQLGFPLSAIQLTRLAFDPANGLMSGGMSAYINRRDARRGIIGDPSTSQDNPFVLGLGLEQFDFCDRLRNPACPNAVFPGCADEAGNPVGVCPEESQELCTGWALPLIFESVAVDRAITDRLIRGLDDMSCSALSCD